MSDSLPQNDLIMMVTIGILIMLLLALAFVLFFYFSQQKFQRQQQLAQEQEMRHQEQLLYGSIQAQEQERERLARELHDEVGSKLNVINLGLHQLHKDEPASEQLNELFGVLGNTITTTRQISHDLLPPTLENFGLATALEELCDQVQSASGMEVVFSMRQLDQKELDKDTALSFFRAAQELINNSLKYAQASRLDIELIQQSNSLQLNYSDNGQGFDPEHSDHQKGLGMNNIESRMRMINADFQFNSQPGAGVKFQAKKLYS